MPTYEYECEKCGHKFEYFQSMSSERLKVCPECKGKVRRLIGTGAGIIFKGSGFYETDYRSKSYQDGASKDSKAKSEAKKESSGDSKKKSKKSNKSKSGGGQKKEKAAG